jgi:hypothetical protein
LYIRVFDFILKINFEGKNTDELLATWHREATFALTARKGGVHIELFKNVGERKV